MLLVFFKLNRSKWPQAEGKELCESYSGYLENRNTWGAKNYSLKHKINRTKKNKKKTGTIIKAAVKSMSKFIISCPSALIKK